MPRVTALLLGFLSLSVASETGEGVGDGLGQIPLPAHGQDVLGYQSACGSSGSDLLVETALFAVQGAESPETPRVRQFLGIPFAEPPVGELRFRPPVTKAATNETVDATEYGPYCFQHNPGASAAFSLFPGNAFPPDQVQSEDCLTLDIWAPREKCDDDGDKVRSPKTVGDAAVLIWVHGGALMTGDSSPPYTRGVRIVEKHKDIIVVSINYRVNIFGFPGAEALDGRKLNPAFLDVRKGIEWVYENIHHFGGDPNRMVIFGDSAGSTCVDKYVYAWAHDPLVKGFISMSGQGELSGDPTDHSNFNYVAGRLGCKGDKDELFRCMQAADANDIAEILNTYDPKANGGKILSFMPQSDNETSFSNYTDLQIRGLYAPLPQIIGTCNNEFASLITLTEEAPDQDLLDRLSNGMFICPAAKASRARQDRGTPIWRYRYFGEWPNMNPLPWMHAYHGSDVPMVFGTTDLYEPNTPEEAAVSEYMQSVWVEFTKDPEHALTDKFGWPRYVHDEETLVRIAFEGSTRPSFVRGNTYDDSCGKDPPVQWPIE